MHSVIFIDIGSLEFSLNGKQRTKLCGCDA